MSYSPPTYPPPVQKSDPVYNTELGFVQPASQEPITTNESEEHVIPVASNSSEKETTMSTLKMAVFAIAVVAVIVAIVLGAIYWVEKAKNYQPMRAFGSNIDVTTKTVGRKNRSTEYILRADIVFQYLEENHTVSRYKETFSTESRMDKLRTALRSAEGAKGWVSAHNMLKITFNYWEPVTYLYVGITFVVLFICMLCLFFCCPSLFDNNKGKNKVNPVLNF